MHKVSLAYLCMSQMNVLRISVSSSVNSRLCSLLGPVACAVPNQIGRLAHPARPSTVVGQDVTERHAVLFGYRHSQLEMSYLRVANHH